ncbi:KdsC family phosphatase [Desulfoferula mesophila]|uniref:Haloacid dehalogenase n=1 Tax=Desulfoferula mesophila TaxID=3058419 RepID=A0AAU9F2Y4_9BACT|nr:haloacid dehalogenase [Desulfoferula mesophilus]
MSEITAQERAARIKLLVLDIDGVLTDGRVVYDQDGRELKFFDIKDGHGLKLLQRAGFKIVWLSGRASKVNQVRAQELGIDELVEDCKIKLPRFERVLSEHGMQPEQAAFMGDDLIDLPPMRAAGLALAPADAWPEVRQAAHWVATLPGGRGAVRQACELLLKASGKWDEVTGRYF